MKTYIWADTNCSALEYQFLAVMANSLEEAKELMKAEINKIDDIWGYMKYFLDNIERYEPIILEPNTAKIIDHANE